MGSKYESKLAQQAMDSESELASVKEGYETLLREASEKQMKSAITELGPRNHAKDDGFQAPIPR